MQRNVLRTDALQTPSGHCFSRRRMRAASASAGFFTIGIAIAVLAAGSLFAGAMELVDDAATASAPAAAQVAGDRAQPAGAETEGVGSVAVSEAHSDSSKRARGDVPAPQ